MLRPARRASNEPSCNASARLRLMAPLGRGCARVKISRVMRHPEISDRQREILLKTLELYISTGLPVGSRALADEVEASSSTVRSELAYLESVGLLTHPHTSAGRLPTDAGYRYYVDALMSADLGEAVSFATPRGFGTLDELRRGVSEDMSEVTRLLAVVAGPSALGDSLSRADYVSLPGGALLLVVSMGSGSSSSTTLVLPAPVEDGELREMFVALNSWIGGRPVGSDLELAKAARKALSDHNPPAVHGAPRARPGGSDCHVARAPRKAVSDHSPLGVAGVLEAVGGLGGVTERGVFV